MVLARLQAIHHDSPQSFAHLELIFLMSTMQSNGSLLFFWYPAPFQECADALLPFPASTAPDTLGILLSYQAHLPPGRVLPFAILQPEHATAAGLEAQPGNCMSKCRRSKSQYALKFSLIA